MRHTGKSQHKRGAYARLLWACILGGVLLLAGCGTRGAATGELEGVPAEQDDMLQYVPQDDGIALSSSELEALNSTGELDVRLSRDAMDDISIQYKYFLHRARPTFERFLRRMEVYLPYVKQVFRERGLPEELAYIAFIESGYNPLVVSRAGAAGTWQFMPFTGRKYGLEQDWWMDERHDTFKATHAAADYLTKLRGMFQDWHLAIAAYNAGEGKISRALEGAGAKDFFELVRKNAMLDEKTQLKDETKQYVPRFLAVCKMMRNLEKLGFIPPAPGAATTLTRVEARPGTDLVAVAQAAGMDWSEFSSRNPAYRRHVSPLDRGSPMYVPEHAKDRVLACLDDAGAQGAGGWRSYTARKKDSWQRISANSGVPVGVLKKVNGNKMLKAGVVLRIPGSGTSPAAARIAQATPAAVKKKEGGKLVAAARKNTASMTGKHAAPRKNFPVKAMKDAQPAKAETKANNGKTGGKTYRVQPGDTMWSIARKHNLPPLALMRANRLDNAALLRPGDTIRVALK